MPLPDISHLIESTAAGDRIKISIQASLLQVEFTLKQDASCPFIFTNTRTSYPCLFTFAFCKHPITQFR